MSDFKVRCVESTDRAFKAGKVYEVKNGVLASEIWDFNSTWTKSIESINRFCSPNVKFELVTEPQQFTKDMLRTGMWVETNGYKLMVLLNTENGDIFVNSNSDWLSMDNYSKELKNKIDCRWDVLKVFVRESPARLLMDCPDTILWQRPEIPKMTHAEITEKLGHEFEYVKE